MQQRVLPKEQTMTSLRNRDIPIASSIRKKKSKNNVTLQGISYYDPIYRIGENIPVTLSADDRYDDLIEGDALLVNKEDEPTGFINTAQHTITGDVTNTAIMRNYSFYGALQKSQPKLNDIIQKNPGQNRENAPMQMTSFVLTDVHADDVGETYAFNEKLYATPEEASPAYNALKTAPNVTVWRMTVAREATFEKVLNLAGAPANVVAELKAKFCVGRAHQGKKANYGNVYYTIGFGL